MAISSAARGLAQQRRQPKLHIALLSLCAA
eukprot:SAG11_NODE_2786_length_2974_cov_3.011478_1_plen_29_part_10